MGTSNGTTTVVQTTTTSGIKMYPSGELYVDMVGLASLLLMPDTANGKTYKLTITNGVLQPVEV